MKHTDRELDAAFTLLKLGEGSTPYVPWLQIQHSPDVRKRQSQKVRDSHPDRIPVILESHPSAATEFRQVMILTIPNITLSMFILRVRDNLKLDRNVRIIVSVPTNQTHLINFDMTMGELYKRVGDSDGFLYILYLPVV